MMSLEEMMYYTEGSVHLLTQERLMTVQGVKTHSVLLEYGGFVSAPRRLRLKLEVPVSV